MNIAHIWYSQLEVSVLNIAPYQYYCREVELGQRLTLRPGWHYKRSHKASRMEFRTDPLGFSGDQFGLEDLDVEDLQIMDSSSIPSSIFGVNIGLAIFGLCQEGSEWLGEYVKCVSGDPGVTVVGRPSVGIQTMSGWHRKFNHFDRSMDEKITFAFFRGFIVSGSSNLLRNLPHGGTIILFGPVLTVKPQFRVPGKDVSIKQQPDEIHSLVFYHYLAGQITQSLYCNFVGGFFVIFRRDGRRISQRVKHSTFLNHQRVIKVLRYDTLEASSISQSIGIVLSIVFVVYLPLSQPNPTSVVIRTKFQGKKTR
ncbi:hypothetical protein F5880DRAFT_1505771 [Lentinula raphanica]|nr:hypothetical protein F5880DRAFT_1505771 [Lentinula raphanica]